MSRRRRIGRLLLGSILVAGLVTGCTASPPEPTQTPTSTSAAPAPSVSETPPSVDPLSAVTTVLARPEALELQDASGVVVESLGYLSESETALAVLTDVFGEAPVDTEYPGGSHDAPSTAHRWGAFELWEARYVDKWEGLGTPASFYRPSFRVRFTGAESAGITLATVDGVGAGSAWSELDSFPELQTNPSGCSGPYLDFVEFPETWPDGTEHVRKVAVEFQPSEDGASIGMVRAPVPVYEDGCA